MELTTLVKERVEERVNSLPPVAQGELIHFLNYLEYKYRTERPGDVVKLGGLWSNVEFDVGDEDVRALRQAVTAQLLTKV